MKFCIDQIIIWQKNNEIRRIKFEENKINVITGTSGTGKSDIINIFDYCFFASEHSISERIVNESSLWYGVIIKVNEHKYTIARRKPGIGTKSVSKDYYFSSLGHVPFIPKSTITEKELRSIIEKQFNINSDLKIKFGSDLISSNSKVSLRYLLMFNYISSSIIDNKNIFFDKQHISRYKEALPRIFDYCVNIDTIENKLKKDKFSSLNKEKEKLEKKSLIKEDYISLFEDDISNSLSLAKSYGFQSSENKSELEQLQEIINNATTDEQNLSKRDDIENKIYNIDRKLSNLTRFEREYNEYRKNNKYTIDSLESIEFFKINHNDILKTSIYSDLILSLNSELNKIKKENNTRTPIRINTQGKKNELKKEKDSLIKQLKSLPENNKAFTSAIEKYFFLGELNAKLSLYSKQRNKLKDKDIERIEKIKGILKNINLKNTDINKEIFKGSLQEIMKRYVDFSGDALGDYKNYYPIFDYNEKTIGLRRPNYTEVENTGSSGYNVFLSLIFSFSLHEIISENNNLYIAPFLFIDQPSRPFWPDNIKEQQNLNLVQYSDDYKLRKLLELMNEFIKNIHEKNNSFQIILLEHIPSNTWKGLNNYYLVETFIDGHALIN